MSRLPLSLVLATAALVLAGQAPGSAAGHAAYASKPAQTRTYVLTYTLTGTYKAADTFGQADGFCDGTDSTEGAKFSDSSAGTLKLTADKTGQRVYGVSVAKSGSLGSWAGETDSVAEGDDCAGNIHHHVCSGQVNGEGDGSGTYVAAASTASKVRFLSSITAVPSEETKASDCASDTDYPGLAVHLEPALDPYDTVQADVAWSRLDKLAVGSSLKVTAAYTSKPSGYNLATCNGDGHCKAHIDSFVHTLTIKRTR